MNNNKMNTSPNGGFNIENMHPNKTNVNTNDKFADSKFGSTSPTYNERKKQRTESVLFKAEYDTPVTDDVAYVPTMMQMNFLGK